ncbi:MAG: MarR family transcriptional regulator [Deltaproteobacteria bacterium]|nr:MarR family transcriptional regulator [Deltaproteobacteria bacterium]
MFRLEDSLGFLLNRAALSMRRSIEGKLKPYGLTAPQWAVLARLWEEDGQSPTVIGKSLFFDKPTIKGILDRLERKGFVKRARDAKDRRVTNIFLARKGDEMREKLPNIALGVNKSAAKGLTAAEMTVLKRSLKAVWCNLEE